MELDWLNPMHPTQKVHKFVFDGWSWDNLVGTVTW
jgi:hypothetical protein